MQTELFGDFSKIPDQKNRQNIISTPKSESDGHQKIENDKIGVKGIRNQVSTCTKPNLRSVAAQNSKDHKLYCFFAL